jgi:hypothetical protein
MKRATHISASTVIGVLAGVREFYGELPGTGQSLMSLMHSGWNYLDIHRYFPWTAVNLILLGSAAVWMLFTVRSGRGRNA